MPRRCPHDSVVEGRLNYEVGAALRLTSMRGEGKVISRLHESALPHGYCSALWRNSTDQEQEFRFVLLQIWCSVTRHLSSNLLIEVFQKGDRQPETYASQDWINCSAVSLPGASRLFPRNRRLHNPAMAGLALRGDASTSVSHRGSYTQVTFWHSFTSQLRG